MGSVRQKADKGEAMGKVSEKKKRVVGGGRTNTTCLAKKKKAMSGKGPKRPNFMPTQTTSREEKAPRSHGRKRGRAIGRKLSGRQGRSTEKARDPNWGDNSKKKNPR